MYDFVTDNSAAETSSGNRHDKRQQVPAPAADETIWSRVPLEGLTAGALTPFSGSVLSEVVGRAVYEYYERLDFEPPLSRQLVRVRKGRVFLNVSAIARIEARHADVQPFGIRINGERFPQVNMEKRGLFSGFQTKRAQKKIDALMEELGQGIDSTARTASHWLQRTRNVQWSQAEILQVMEEIERTGVKAMMAYISARYKLERLYSELIDGLADKIAYPASLSLINGALADQQSLVESQIAASLVDLAVETAVDDKLLRWLEETATADWISGEGTMASPPSKELANGITAFLEIYGHRAVDEAEMAHPRWYENPAPVMHALLGIIENHSHQPTKTPAANQVQRLLEKLDSATVKRAPAMIDDMHRLHHVQSHALHALAYVWAGTREWAKAAAKETVADGRLAQVDDIFYFELEEIKQLMTGEWNISDVTGIRATVSRRRAAYDEWCEAASPSVMAGNTACWSANHGLSASSGTVTAPLRRLDEAKTDSSRGAVLGMHHLSSGWAVTLATADAYVTADGTPMDPCVVAARVWHRPAVVGLGESFDKLVEGALTTVDGDAAHVEQ